MPRDRLSFLPNNVVMALTFMFSSSNYHKEMNSTQSNDIQISIKVKRIINHALKLIESKEILLKFINQNLKLFAPDLTALLGADVAGKLITCAGGIVELAKCPSGNIINMGTHQVNNDGLSNRNKWNNGYLTLLDEYKMADDKMKIKVLRRYSNKTALAAKADAFGFNKESENEYGKNLKEKIAEKISKIETNKQPVLVKPLPKPDEKSKRRRGGRKLKGIKQRYEMTEARMLKNRMKFGTEPEKEFRDTGVGFGLLKIGGVGGQIRMKKNEKRIVTKKMKIIDKKFLHDNHNFNKFTNGMHSSVVMSNEQGIQLMNPDLFKGGVQNDNTNIFNQNSGFNTVIKNRLGEI